MGRNFRESLAEQMKDPAFKEEWDALKPVLQNINEIADKIEDPEPRLKAVNRDDTGQADTGKLDGRPN